MKRTGENVRFLMVLLAWLFSQAAFAGDTNWCLKIVDDMESPIPEAQIFYRWEGYADWEPAHSVLRLGQNRDGGEFQTIGETVSNLRESYARAEFLRLPINYYFGMSVRAAHGWLKVVAPGFEPVEMQVPFPSDYKWERVQLQGRYERHRGRGQHVENRLPDALVVLQVLAENDQRTPQDDTPLAGAQVTVTVEASGRVFQAVSDGGGNVQLRVPEPGHSLIEVSCEGYRPNHWRARLESGQQERQRITLLTARMRR